MPAALAGAAALTDSQAAKAAPNMVRRRKKRLLVAHKKSSGQIKRKPASHVSTTCSLSVYLLCNRHLGVPQSRSDASRPLMSAVLQNYQSHALGLEKLLISNGCACLEEPAFGAQAKQKWCQPQQRSAALSLAKLSGVCLTCLPVTVAEQPARQSQSHAFTVLRHSPTVVPTLLFGLCLGCLMRQPLVKGEAVYEHWPKLSQPPPLPFTPRLQAQIPMCRWWPSGTTRTTPPLSSAPATATWRRGPARRGAPAPRAACSARSSAPAGPSVAPASPLVGAGLLCLCQSSATQQSGALVLPSVGARLLGPCQSRAAQSAVSWHRRRWVLGCWVLAIPVPLNKSPVGQVQDHLLSLPVCRQRTGAGC